MIFSLKRSEADAAVKGGLPLEGDHLWHKTLLSADATIEMAMASFNESALGIAMVVDDTMRLLGVITDGDLRRAVLAKKGLDTCVSSVMNVNPVTIELGALLSPADEERMRSVRGHPIPIVNASRMVVGLVGADSSIDVVQRDNWVLLMAGGFGTRLADLTKNCPKPMLKVGGRPILERIVDQLIQHGFHKFFISVHYLPEVIMDHFGDGSRFGVTIKYLHERQPLGTAGALGFIEEVDDKPVIVMNCDLITRIDLTSLTDFHEVHDNKLTVCVREYDMQVPFGVVEGEGGVLHRLVEKPLHRFFVNAGIYVIDPDIVIDCEADKRLDMPDLINQLIDRELKVGMFPIYETWLDVGRPDDFSRAQSM